MTVEEKEGRLVLVHPHTQALHRCGQDPGQATEPQKQEQEEENELAFGLFDRILVLPLYSTMPVFKVCIARPCYSSQRPLLHPEQPVQTIVIKQNTDELILHTC